MNLYGEALALFWQACGNSIIFKWSQGLINKYCFDKRKEYVVGTCEGIFHSLQRSCLP
jgi:hypothetical protein